MLLNHKKDCSDQACQTEDSSIHFCEILRRKHVQIIHISPHSLVLLEMEIGLVEQNFGPMRENLKREIICAIQPGMRSEPPSLMAKIFQVSQNVFSPPIMQFLPSNIGVRHTVPCIRMSALAVLWILESVA
jgi:hypothetical protein